MPPPRRAVGPVSGDPGARWAVAVWLRAAARRCSACVPRPPGAPRVFTPAPDLVVYNEGTNDGSTNITDLLLAVVRGVQVVAPRARQLLLQPFNGGHALDLPLVAAAAGPLVTYASTVGFYNGADGLHPFGYAHMADISPSVSELCLPLLVGARSSTVGAAGGSSSGGTMRPPANVVYRSPPAMLWPADAAMDVGLWRQLGRLPRTGGGVVRSVMESP